jgi:hypothetical protein
MSQRNPSQSLRLIKMKSPSKVRLFYLFVGAACLVGMIAGFLLDKLAQIHMQELSNNSPLLNAKKNSRTRNRQPAAGSMQNATKTTVTLSRPSKGAPLKPLSDMPEYTGYARAYQSWPDDRPFPCFPAHLDDSNNGGYMMLVKPVQDGAGLLFHRPAKTGSTTVAGTVMRIAHRKAHLVQGSPATPACRHRANHGTAHTDFQYQHRNKKKSFLFSIIREPTKRAISQFFHFAVSAGHMEPTDAVFQREMMTATYGHYYMWNLGLRYVPNVKKADHKLLVKEIIDGYDFIGITERMDESLVVFKMLLGLDLEDILYVRERSQGGFSNGPPARPCLYVWPSFVTDGMKAFFASEKWMNHMKGDYMLYEAAKKSLDLTIDRLGRAKVEKEVYRFKAALKIAEEICAPRAVPMCTKDGARANKTTCYIWAEGCSHECLDEIKLPDQL